MWKHRPVAGNLRYLHSLLLFTAAKIQLELINQLPIRRCFTVKPIYDSFRQCHWFAAGRLLVLSPFHGFHFLPLPSHHSYPLHPPGRCPTCHAGFTIGDCSGNSESVIESIALTGVCGGEFTCCQIRGASGISCNYVHGGPETRTTPASLPP